MAAETETIEETEAGTRSHMWKHEDIYEWLIEEGHLEEDATGPEVIAAFAAKRNEYRKTDRYRDLVESKRAEAEETAAAKREAREAAKAEREAAKAEKAAAKEAAAAEGDSDTKGAKKAPAKKAPAKKAPAKKAAAKADDESPFD